MDISVYLQHKSLGPVILPITGLLLRGFSCYTHRMHTILCFGDSNTFGTNPSGGRWAYESRWTGILAGLLGPSFYVIEEGMGGRTTVFDDPLEPNRCGKQFLPVALQSHRPLDLVIVSLGTNDCKVLFHANERIIANALEQLIALIRTYPYGEGYPIPQILVVSPIHIGLEIEKAPFVSYDASSALLSRKLAPAIERMAKQRGALFLDASKVAQPSEIDQLHMNREGHLALAQALHPMIASLF